MASYPSLGAYIQSQPKHNVDQPLPMRFSYGPRFNEASGEFSAPDQKGIGFFGPMMVTGPSDVASEYSRADKMNGKLTSYPTIYPGMPPAQLGAAMQTIRMNTPQGPQLGPVQKPNIPVPLAVDNAAYDAAKARVNAGRSPFWEQGRDPYPAWSPDQYWEAPYGMR